MKKPRSRYLDASQDLNNEAGQIVTDLESDVASNLAALVGCAADIKTKLEADPRMTRGFIRPGEGGNPADDLNTIVARLRRTDAFFQKAIDLLGERRRTLAELLSEIR
jgi:hypothetical protein